MPGPRVSTLPDDDLFGSWSVRPLTNLPCRKTLEPQGQEAVMDWLASSRPLVAVAASNGDDPLVVVLAAVAIAVGIAIAFVLSGLWIGWWRQRR